VYTVNLLSDTGMGSGNEGDLRYCITQANANADASNAIVFQRGLSGTISLQGAEPTITKALTIKGPGAALITIDGGSLYQVFHVAPSVAATFSAVTVADGKAMGSGGGVLNEGDLTLSGCVFAANAASVDGGAVMNESLLTVRGCTFTDNSAGLIGGAIFNEATAKVNRSMFTGNSARASGGVYSSTALELNNSTFEDNSASQFGGGVVTTKDATLRNCVFEENSASLGGGAVYTINSASSNFELTVTNCSFTANSAGTSAFAWGGGAILNLGVLAVAGSTFDGNTAGSGGGIYNGGQATLRDSSFFDNTATGDFGSGGAVISLGFFNNLSAVNCTFAGNSAAFGGAVSMNTVGQGVSYLLTNCTFNGNSAANEGGAVYDPGIAGFVSCTISGNQVGGSGHGGGVFVFTGNGATATNLDNTIVAGNVRVGGGADDVFGAVNADVSSYNLIGDGTGTNLVDGANGNQVGTRDQPIDPGLGPLQDNGGPTQTMALLAGSPAVGRGDPSLAGTSDQRGTLRGDQPSIGAFEPSAAVSIQLIAPAEVRAGQPFTVTVVALDAWGNVASLYDGTVHFTSTDTAATLPPDYAFTDVNGGRYTVKVTLRTPGPQQLGVADLNNQFADTADVLVRCK
jgi:predicted outer membrane repeat protein